MHDSIRAIARVNGIDVSSKKDGELLQYLGTEWGRKKFGKNVWVNCIQTKINGWIEYLERPDTQEIKKCMFVISDCRFENEFDGFPDALRVRLQCRREVRMKRCTYWRENDTHLSETSLDRYSIDEKFDLYLDTEKADIVGNATLTMAQIDKNVWMEKR